MRKGLIQAVAGVLLALMLPFLAFSESTLREGITSWLDSCLIVVSKQVTKEFPARIAVRLHASGEIPKDLSINFRANEGLIHEIRYFSTTDPSGLSASTSLFLHHLHGQYCPGALCDGVPKNIDGEKRRTVRLAELVAESDQRFYVEFNRDVRPQDLSVFVIQRKGGGSSCRVQNDNAFNWFFRQEKPTKFLVVLGLLFLLSLVVPTLKSSQKE
jgi:hypothetical protein